MKINISGRYLLLPTERNSEEKKLHFYIDGKKVMESDVKLATGKPDFVFAMDVSAYDGKELEIRADADLQLLSEITCSDERPTVSDDKRPLVHFTAESGWINDPNGLVYADGIWHLFYQWNPYGVTWGNMHWGHAVSKDLLHWEHKPVALLPDDYGPMFSGSGWQDKKNVAGYGKDALLFYYTAAGGDNTWSKELSRRYVQRLAVSADGGTTLEKKDTVLSHVVGGNRDPKVFWHEESKAYIMMLYLEETEFAIYRSTDLLHWEESSRLSGEKMWECPDLFELTVDGTDGETRWVFWSADGLYRIGTFDGYSFTPETDVLAGYDTTLPYAAQTYAGVSGRVISVAWYRTANDSDGYRGMMAIPAELSLAETSDGLRIRFCPVREFGKAFPKPTVIDRCDDTVIIDETKIPAVYELKWSAPGSGKVQIGADTFAVKHDDHPTTLIVDHGIAEYFSKEGTVYGAVELMGRCAMETERLILRRWNDNDAEDLFKYASDPDVGPIAGWPPHQTIEESKDIIKNVLSGKEAYAICLKEDGKAIGAIELKLNGHADLAESDDECEMGFWIGKPFWGRGLTPEAAKELLRHAFEDLDMQKVWIGYYEGNAKSKRAQEKIGFKYQWCSENVDVPLMHEKRTGHVSLMTKEDWQKMSR